MTGRWWWSLATMALLGGAMGLACWAVSRAVPAPVMVGLGALAACALLATFAGAADGEGE